MARRDRKQFVAVAGNIGSGKTELVRFLCDRYGLQPSYEPDGQNPYLADFYRDMKAWAFHSQIWFLTHKFRLHQQIQREPATVVQDRTLYEDAEIFARNLHEQRLLSDRDYELYEALYATIRDVLTPPDVMIFLRCPVPTLRKRIARRGRPMEAEIPVEYLRRLNRLYDRWRETYTLSPVIDLSTDKLDYLTDLVDRLDVFRQLEQYLDAPRRP